LSSEAVTAQHPSSSVAMRLMVAVCMPVSSRSKGRVMGSAAIPGSIGSGLGDDRGVHDCKAAIGSGLGDDRGVHDCKAASRMAPLNTQHIAIRRICMS
jgi:hypothetical protein